VAGTPVLIVAKKAFPPKDLKEFVTYVKANVATLKMAHAGVGSVSFTTCLLLNSILGVKPASIPFNGTGPALTALISGQVDYMWDQIVKEQRFQFPELVRILGGYVIEQRPILGEIIQFIRIAGWVLRYRARNVPRGPHHLGAGDPAVMVDRVITDHLEVLRMVGALRVRSRSLIHSGVGWCGAWTAPGTSPWCFGTGSAATGWWFRPVISAARVGEHSDVELKLV